MYRKLFTQLFGARVAGVRVILALGLCALVLAIQPAPVAHAATITVNSLADTAGGSECTLRNAITAANTNTATGGCPAGAGTDTINFSVSGTITLTSALPAISQALTIDGTGQSITVSGNNLYRVFYISNGVTVTISGVTVANGRTDLSGGDGGGIYNLGTLTVTNCTFSNNNTGSAGAVGGGIYNLGTLTVTNCTFSNNRASRGGGILNYLGPLNVTNSTFSGNRGDDNGGGIYNQQATATVTGSTFSSNTANTYGGGILNNQGTVNLTNSTFSGNSVNWYGGGIYNDGGAVNVTNSTFSGNSAVQLGGGIAGAATLKNTIVANSTAGGNCSGTITDGSGNLVWGDTTCPGTNADPKLGALANNGGSTQTMKLGSDSAAIDTAAAANCPSADQRGENRDDLNCDIGAFELKMSDSNWVKRTVSASALSTFGPARAGIQYSGINPGETTIAKVTNWTSQPANALGVWWDITPTTGSGLNLTFKLCYSTTELRGLTEGDLRFWRYSGGTWSQVGGAPTFSGTSPNRCAQITGVTDLSRWTLATGNPGGAPTAVVLQSFGARGVDGAPYAGWLLLTLLTLGIGALLLMRRTLRY